MHVWVCIYTNASRHTFEHIVFGVTVRTIVVMSHTQLSYLPRSHVTHTSESCHTCHTFENTFFENLEEQGFWCHHQDNNRALLHARLMHESCHTYARVMSHIRTRHAARAPPSRTQFFWCCWKDDHTLLHARLLHESWHTYEWVISQVRMSHTTLSTTQFTNGRATVYEWVTPHHIAWLIRTHTNEYVTNESRHIFDNIVYELITPQFANESRHTP